MSKITFRFFSTVSEFVQLSIKFSTSSFSLGGTVRFTIQFLLDGRNLLGFLGQLEFSVLLLILQFFHLVSKISNFSFSNSASTISTVLSRSQILNLFTKTITSTIQVLLGIFEGSFLRTKTVHILQQTIKLLSKTSNFFFSLSSRTGLSKQLLFKFSSLLLCSLRSLSSFFFFSGFSVHTDLQFFSSTRKHFHLRLKLVLLRNSCVKHLSGFIELGTEGLDFFLVLDFIIHKTLDLHLQLINLGRILHFPVFEKIKLFFNFLNLVLLFFKFSFESLSIANSFLFQTHFAFTLFTKLFSFELECLSLLVSHLLSNISNLDLILEILDSVLKLTELVLGNHPRHTRNLGLEGFDFCVQLLLFFQGLLFFTFSTISLLLSFIGFGCKGFNFLLEIRFTLFSSLQLRTKIIGLTFSLFALVFGTIAAFLFLLQK
mmetsp:Transcript_37184/g.51332  ORF Transcript_37184/g.51332 Transcript_37184/m.51332 type:complete len:430 (-) Transcript_37184:706-1995(-)